MEEYEEEKVAVVKAVIEKLDALSRRNHVVQLGTDDCILIAGDNSVQDGGTNSYLSAGRNSYQAGGTNTCFYAGIGTVQTVKVEERHQDCIIHSTVKRTITKELANRWFRYDGRHWLPLQRGERNSILEWIYINVTNGGINDFIIDEEQL